MDIWVAPGSSLKPSSSRPGTGLGCVYGSLIIPEKPISVSLISTIQPSKETMYSVGAFDKNKDQTGERTWKRLRMAIGNVGPMSVEKSSSLEVEIDDDVGGDKGVRDLVGRERVLLDEANQLFNRLESNISYLGGKVSSFFGILLGLISLQVTLVALLLNNGGRFSVYSHGLLVLFSAIMTVSALLSVSLLRPRSYRDVEVFKEDRFERLSICSTQDLLSDLLYYTREAYEHNYEIYNKNTDCLNALYALFLTGNMLYVLLVLSMWIQ